jgi:hypothetical protein
MATLLFHPRRTSHCTAWSIAIATSSEENVRRIEKPAREAIQTVSSRTRDVPIAQMTVFAEICEGEKKGAKR